jgi:hypothetical protein
MVEDRERAKRVEWCPGQESNLNLELRRLLFYPLNYQGLLKKIQ